MATNQRATALAFLDAFATLDAEASIALRTPGCKHTLAPATLNRPHPMSNDDFRAHLTRMRPLLSAFPVTPTEIFADDGGRVVNVWATSEAVFREEVKGKDDGVDWTYRGEYLFVLCFDEKGDKIERIVEFLDSQKANSVFGLMDRARKNLAARG